MSPPTNTTHRKSKKNPPEKSLTMPSANERPLVLVTAVNGFIASWTAKAFLDAGYNVRGTTRSAKSSHSMLEAEPFKSYASAGRFTIVQVPNITLPGAFDEAVRGCHAIAHTASPMSLNFSDPEPVINTAVKGVRSVLDSAHLSSGSGTSTVKSFVLLSSIAAVIGKKPEDNAAYRFTEADWDNVSQNEVARLDKQTPSMMIYKASKTAAERAMWDFQRDKKPTFTMTAVNPVYVWGPPVLFPENPEDLNITAKVVWTIFSGQEIPPPFGGSNGAVDVRDVARLILFAVQEKEKADNQRFIAASGVRSEQAVADILREAYPDRRDIIKEGTPGVGYLPDYSVPEDSPAARVDNTKAVRVTGKEWISPKQSITDAAKAFERYL
jgi:nucleoside-diphosphate-sugar epimerase